MTIVTLVSGCGNAYPGDGTRVAASPARTAPPATSAAAIPVMHR